MLYVSKNTQNDVRVIVTVDNYNYYIFKLVDSRGNETLLIGQKVLYTPRYTKVELKKADINLLSKGEYKYYIYMASHSNDNSTANKEILEKGIIKVL